MRLLAPRSAPNTCKGAAGWGLLFGGLSLFGGTEAGLITETKDAQMHRPDAASANSMIGTVCKKLLGQYWVNAEGRTVQCAISNRLRKELVYPIADPTSLRHRVMAVESIRTVDPVAIGDHVQFTDAGDEHGVITAVLPRKNKLMRRAAGPKPLEQVIEI